MAPQSLIHFYISSGLPADRYSFWVLGFSAAAQKYVAPSADPNVGTWVPTPAGTGTIPSFRIGRGPGEIIDIALSRDNPAPGARLYVVLVPAGNASEVLEVTQTADSPRFVINLQVVDGFIFPATITASPLPAGTVPFQVGQPLGASGAPADGIDRQTIFSAYRDFIAREPLSDALKAAYTDLLDKSGATPGLGADSIINGILSPKSFLATRNPVTTASSLQAQYDGVLAELYRPGNVVGMRSDDRLYYLRGTAREEGGKAFLDFEAFNGSGCAVPNPALRYRVYSPLTPPNDQVAAVGTAAFMIFGNAGVYADASAASIIDGPVSIGLALQRDISAALNRGVALLPRPTGGESFGCFAESTVYWATQTKWYPLDQVYNNYARFAHVGKVNGTQIFVPPPIPAADAQGIIMGQSYGFPFDETPGNGDIPAGEQPNVPSKFNPVPEATLFADVQIDTFGALS